MHARAAVAIRRAAAADLPAVLALYREVGDRATIPLGQARRVLARMRSYPDYDLYVASSGGEIVGTFALLIMDNLAHLAAPSGVIEDVVVRRDCQRRGIGRRMMQWARQRCRARGCYKLALSSSRHRRAAHRFYATLGFRRHGVNFRLELPGRRRRRRST